MKLTDNRSDGVSDPSKQILKLQQQFAVILISPLLLAAVVSMTAFLYEVYMGG